MKLKFAIPFILIAIMFFNSCKKYEEGPFISFRSAKHRIDGSWKIESFTANGADSMNYIYRYHLEGQWYFSRFDGPSYPALSVNTGSYRYLGEWDTAFPNNSLLLTFIYLKNNNTNIYYYLFPNDWVWGDYWDIIKLKKNNMKLKLTKGGIEYIISFKQY